MYRSGSLVVFLIMLLIPLRCLAEWIPVSELTEFNDDRIVFLVGQKLVSKFREKS